MAAQYSKNELTLHTVRDLTRQIASNIIPLERYSLSLKLILAL